MIKSSLRSAGMTECLINFKYVLFGQPNQMDGKYCLSWQAGPSINFVLFVLVVASAGRLAPIITFVLLRNRSFWFHPDITEPPPLQSTGGKHKDKYFRSVLPEDFINPAHVRFLEPPSIFPSQHLLAPPLSLSSWPVCEAAAGAPPLGSPLRKAPRRVDETSPQPGPKSRCEAYKRLPFSPDIHKKDSLRTPPPPALL